MDIHTKWLRLQQLSCYTSFTIDPSIPATIKFQLIFQQASPIYYCLYCFGTFGGRSGRDCSSPVEGKRPLGIGVWPRERCQWLPWENHEVQSEPTE